MRRVLGFLLFLVLCCPAAMAQIYGSNPQHKANHSLDSLRQAFQADSAHLFRSQKLRPYVAIDNRNSFIRDAPINITGVQVGVIIHERHTLCIGGYTLSAQSKSALLTKGKTEPTIRHLTIDYLTIFYQYTLIDKRFLEVDIPVEAGFGQFEIQLYSKKTNKLLSDKTRGLVPLGAGVQLVLKPFKWVGFSSMVGYRYVVDQDPNVNFNGFYYSYGAWVDVRQILRDSKFYFIKRPRYRKKVNELRAQK